jgi:hypothetical protein
MIKGGFVMHPIRRVFVVIALALLLGAQPGVAHAQSDASEVGYGMLSAVTSLVYAPVKIVYAVGGGVIGGLAWLLSAGDNDVMNAIVTPAVRGDYVVTPTHLRGEQPLEFIGREPGY